jgi:hypothetical protein
MARWPDGWIVTGTAAGRIGDKDHGFIADARNATTQAVPSIAGQPSKYVARTNVQQHGLAKGDRIRQHSCDPRQLWIKLHIDQIAKSCIS